MKKRGPIRNWDHCLYRVWGNMKSRCSNKNVVDYKYYGGRGISVCERWKESFWNFVEDMGDRPDGYSLDRIDNNKGYSKENCRWATAYQQRNNTRALKYKSGIGVSFDVRRNKWVAHLPKSLNKKENKKMWIGYFPDRSSAEKAVLEVAKKYK